MVSRLLTKISYRSGGLDIVGLSVREKDFAMAKNPVQFQKGLSLPVSLDAYGTEQQCERALYRWCWPDGFVCPQCQQRSHCKLNSRRLHQCYRCHHQTSVISGTIFAFDQARVHGSPTGIPGRADTTDANAPPHDS